MKRRLSLLIACLFMGGMILSSCTANTAKENSELNKKFSECQRLWSQHNLTGAKKTAEDILKEDPGMLPANYMLALMEYHYDKEYDAALLHIQKAIDRDPGKMEFYEMKGDIYFAAGDYKKSIDSYNLTLSKDKSSSSTYYKLARSYLKLDSRDEAVKFLEEGFKINPYKGDISRTLHSLYIEDEKYSSAYDVWKTYNLVVEGKTPVGYIGEWDSLYKKALKDGKNHYAMGDLYYKLRLYDEAAIELKKAVEGGVEKDMAQKVLTEVKAFVTFRDDMVEYLDSYYRDTAVIGTSSQQNFYNDLMPIYDKIASIFPNIKKTEGFSKLRFDEINKSIEEKFGVLITYFPVNRYQDCYFGYVISENVEKVSQWGKEADEKVTIIRDMVSKGFTYWYTLNQSGTGGWTLKEGEFVYIFDPQGSIEFYNRAASDKFRNDMLSENKKLSPNPDEKKALDVYYSQYLSILFQFKYFDSKTQQGKEKGLSGDDLKAYIANLMIDDYYNAQILAHEGQHALDAQFLKIYALPEYRQKLSEMAYGANQFYCLNQFMTLNLGNTGDAHGKANEQVLKDMVKYICDHKDKYPGVDTNKNILSQMVNLKAEDIKDMATNIFKEQFPTSY